MALFSELAELCRRLAATPGRLGARRLRDERLATLAGRASDLERAILGRIIGGEMRTGVSDGLVLEAIGEAAGAELPAVRRAALFLGDLSAVATLARIGGPGSLAEAGPQIFVPLLPMLAGIATDFAEVLSARCSPPTLGARPSSTSTTAPGSSSIATAIGWPSGAGGCPR